MHYLPRNYLFALGKTETIEDLLHIAFLILNDIPQPISIVCGPIMTGGKGSPKENLIFFNWWIRELRRRGLNVFSQMPFEPHMQRIYRKTGVDILEEFYRPLFTSGKIHSFHFIPGWRTSKGAKWERRLAITLPGAIVINE